MQKVITIKQARQITGGRKPLVPVVYEEAVRALGACLSLDDAKEWDNKADALAAWAKIYRDGEVQRQAKSLKLHAYRRMGELAAVLRTQHHKKERTGQFAGSSGGARAVLRAHGLSAAGAIAAMALAKMPKARYDALLTRPLAPTTLISNLAAESHSQTWCRLSNGTSSYLAAIRKYPAREAVSQMVDDEVVTLTRRIQEVADWCDAFLQAAGK